MTNIIGPIDNKVLLWLRNMIIKIKDYVKKSYPFGFDYITLEKIIQSTKDNIMFDFIDADNVSSAAIVGLIVKAKKKGEVKIKNIGEKLQLLLNITSVNSLVCIEYDR